MYAKPLDTEFSPLTPQDEEHLRLLSIFYYVLAGFTAVFSMFPVIHLVVGLLFMFAGLGGEEAFPAVLFGGFFALFALFFIACGLTLAACLAIAGRAIARCERYTFCFVVAAVVCGFWPLGTALGVFTIIVLLREPVKAAFEGENAEIEGGGHEDASEVEFFE